jgi:ribose transport system permease protein
MSTTFVQSAKHHRNRSADLFREYGIVWVTIVLFIVLSITTGNFLSSRNLTNVLDQNATLFIAAAALTLPIIAGGFDVSVSAIYVLSPLVALRVENSTGSVWLSIAVGVAVGVAAGAVNAFCTAVLNINSFVATLATSFAFFGLAYVVSDASILRPSDLNFREWATTDIAGLSSKTWMAFVIVATLWIALERTPFGRYVFAVGTNQEAASLSGIRVRGVVITAFVLSGAAAGLAGTINAASSLNAQASDDFSFAFAAISAVVVGGTSVAGGEGAIWRTVAGVLFIALLTNGFNLNGVDPVYQRIIQGVVILIAVALDAWGRSRRS